MSKDGSQSSGCRELVAQYFRIIKGVGIAVLFMIGITLALLFPGLPSRHPYNVKVGDIAPEDIRAPRAITYVSQIETQAARQAAASGVTDVYDPPDSRIGRQQVRKTHQIIEFVREVRADPVADVDLKLAYVGQVASLNLPPDQAKLLLSISDEQFDQLDRQVVALVEEAMSGTVREGRVQDVTRGLELKISSDFPESLIPLSVAMASVLVVPNSILNHAATDAAHNQAIASVPEVRHTFQPGEIIVRAGEQVDDLDLEAMVALGLTTNELGWEDIASAILVSVLVTGLMVIYLVALRPAWASNLSQVRLVAGLFLVFLLAAQLVVPGQPFLAYLFPAAALAMTLRALAGIEFASLTAVVFGGIIGYVANGSLELATFAAVSGLMAAGTLRQGARLAAFFQSGMAGALGGAAVLLIFRVPAQAATPDLAQLLGFAALNGLFATGITLVILVAVGGLTSQVTSLQLIDLMRPDHPLQRRLQQEALGTYQHTLSVVNLVEAAAESIHADALLARVGTLYHDIGKTANPGFFIENRVEGGINPHEKLSPEVSAQILQAHVRDGIELGRKYRLPQQIIAFIAEHHGTLPILYFLDRAKKEAEQSGEPLDETMFHYDGPIPQSRETAILMLADGCESAVRANRPPSVEEMEAIINRIVQQRLDLHQLDNSGLTLDDIQSVKQSLLRTLRGMYHPRVQYPGDERPAAALDRHADGNNVG